MLDGSGEEAANFVKQILPPATATNKTKKIYSEENS